MGFRNVDRTTGSKDRAPLDGMLRGGCCLQKALSKSARFGLLGPIGIGPRPRSKYLE